jgi:hypothetical protein
MKNISLHPNFTFAYKHDAMTGNMAATSADIFVIHRVTRWTGIPDLHVTTGVRATMLQLLRVDI